MAKLASSLHQGLGARLLGGAVSVAAALGLTASADAVAKPAHTRAGAKIAGGPEITFAGYKTLSGGRGLLFVELTEATEVQVTRSGRIIEYTLAGARVPLRNNRNPLNLRDFDSAAVNAVLVPDKKKSAVKLVVTLRGDVQPSHRMLARGHGAVLEVELPATSAK